MKFNTSSLSMVLSAVALALVPAAITGLVIFFALAAAGWIFGMYWLLLFGLVICVPPAIAYVFARIAKTVEIGGDSGTASFQTGRKEEFILSDVLEIQKRKLLRAEYQVTICINGSRKISFLTDHIGVRNLQAHLAPHRLYVI